MKLTQKDRDKLWGEDGPYSEVKLTIETRILDERVSRIFVIVEVHINPFTFEIIKKHRKLFENDQKIQDIIIHSEFWGHAEGYVSCAFQGEFKDDGILEKAREAHNMCEQTVIKMHKFILDLINEKKVN